jgi:Kef-type K+ transport system membrane component KefB
MVEQLLLALAVVVLAARAGGALAQRVGQPPVMGEIVVGLVLGPSALGAAWPALQGELFPTEVIGWLQPVAQIGLVLFMFLVGAELHLDDLAGQGHRAVAVSHTSIVVPFALGAGLGWLVHPTVGDAVEQLPFALFVGAAMAVTAFPVLARILKETGLDRTPVGALALACAAIDDITAWGLLAVVLATSQGEGLGEVAVTFAVAAAFILVMLRGVRPLLRDRDLDLPVLLGLALGSAWVTEAIGVHAIFGAFLAGVIVPRREATLGRVSSVEPLLRALLLPVFFVVVGLSTDLGRIDAVGRLAVLALVLVVAVGGKLGGAYVAARVTGASRSDAFTLGVLMNTRGLTEIVILTVGLEAGLIGPTMFAIMVVMALATTFMAAPLLRRRARTLPVPTVPT